VLIFAAEQSSDKGTDTSVNPVELFSSRDLFCKIPTDCQQTGSTKFYLGLHAYKIMYLRFTTYDSDYQIKEDEMGGACSKHGRDEKCVKYFGQET